MMFQTIRNQVEQCAKAAQQLQEQGEERIRKFYTDKTNDPEWEEELLDRALNDLLLQWEELRELLDSVPLSVYPFDAGSGQEQDRKRIKRGVLRSAYSQLRRDEPDMFQGR